MELRASSIIDSEIEGHYAFLPFVEHISTRLHQHDFYEIFLIASGNVFHHINGETLLLQRGNLVFIRPDDAHFYSKHTNLNCELINLAFLTQTFNALINYLGIVPQNERFLTSSLPMTMQLTANARNQLVARLRAWGQALYQDKTQSRLALRALLAQIIADYFVTRHENDLMAVPHWLRELCQQMQHREHVVEGRTALMRLANRSPEYVGRAFKVHLGITPSEFINNLRLDYASDLLSHTDRAVIDICHDVGFGNLSHFYHRFKARWNYSPQQYRKLNQRILVP